MLVSLVLRTCVLGFGVLLWLWSVLDSDFAVHVYREHVCASDDNFRYSWLTGQNQQDIRVLRQIAQNVRVITNPDRHLRPGRHGLDDGLVHLALLDDL